MDIAQNIAFNMMFSSQFGNISKYEYSYGAEGAVRLGRQAAPGVWVGSAQLHQREAVGSEREGDPTPRHDMRPLPPAPSLPSPRDPQRLRFMLPNLALINLIWLLRTAAAKEKPFCVKPLFPG